MNKQKQKSVEELRAYYLKHLPEGVSKSEILHMSDEDLLDMDFFLNEDEDDIFADADDIAIFF